MEIELAFTIDQEIDGLIAMRNKAVFEIGKRLKAVKDDSYFEKLGYDTFDSYVASKKMRPKTARAYVHLYEIFIEKLGYEPDALQGTPWYRLQILAPKVKDLGKDEVDEWIHKAKELSPGDFQAEVQEERANKGFAEKKVYPKLFRCQKCGNWQIPKDLEICKHV